MGNNWKQLEGERCGSAEKVQGVKRGQGRNEASVSHTHRAPRKVCKSCVSNTRTCVPHLDLLFLLEYASQVGVVLCTSSASSTTFDGRWGPDGHFFPGELFDLRYMDALQGTEGTVDIGIRGGTRLSQMHVLRDVVVFCLHWVLLANRGGM